MFLTILLSLGLLGASANNSCEAASAAAMNALAECDTAIAASERALAGCEVAGDPYSTACKLAVEKLAAAKDAYNLAKEKFAAAEDACYSLPREKTANKSLLFLIYKILTDVTNV